MAGHSTSSFRPQISTVNCMIQKQRGLKMGWIRRKLRLRVFGNRHKKRLDCLDAAGGGAERTTRKMLSTRRH